MSHTIKEFILPLLLNVQKTVWRMPILMLGVKGYCCKCGPFRLLRSDLEKKKIFLSGPRKKVINIWKGHKTNYTRGGSCWQSFRGHHFTFRFCINFENKFLFMTPRKILSTNVSRETKKKVTRLSSVVELVGLQKGKHPPPPSLLPFLLSYPAEDNLYSNSSLYSVLSKTKSIEEKAIP